MVTGATSGLGLALVRRLAKLGVGTIVAVGRSTKKLDVLTKELHEEAGSSKRKVIPIIADFSDLESVAQAAQSIKNQVKRIDYLVNNAGIHLTTDEIFGAEPINSVQGYELTFGVNYLAHFLWTELLLPLLRKTKGEARIVQVSSSFHLMTSKVDLVATENLSPYASRGDVNSISQRFRAYSYTKLAQMFHTRSLNRQFQEKDSFIRAIAVCPGWVSTNIGRGYVEKKILELLAFPVDGYGLQTLINAMFHPSPDVDFLVSNHLVGNSKLSLSHVLPISKLASDLYIRDGLTWALASTMILVQKFVTDAFIPGASSPDSNDVDAQVSLDNWSRVAVAEWI